MTNVIQHVQKQVTELEQKVKYLNGVIEQKDIELESKSKQINIMQKHSCVLENDNQYLVQLLEEYQTAEDQQTIATSTNESLQNDITTATSTV
jgi:cell shape-determining protein MreC